jgi:hypothetical protein
MREHMATNQTVKEDIICHFEQNTTPPHAQTCMNSCRVDKKKVKSKINV